MSLQGHLSETVRQSCSWPRGSLRQSQRTEERLEEKVLENEDPGPWDSLDLEKEQYLGLQTAELEAACPQG